MCVVSFKLMDFIMFQIHLVIFLRFLQFKLILGFLGVMIFVYVNVLLSPVHFCNTEARRIGGGVGGFIYLSRG